MQTPGYPGHTHTNMDPLATNYFTNGQMGYMPNSQYLTPSEYGAFRTPQSREQYPTGYSYPGFTQSLMTTWRGADKSGAQRAIGEFAAPSPMGANQIGYQAEAARKVRDSIDAATSSVIDAGIKLVATGGGFAFGGIGGAMMGYQLAPKVGSIFTDRTRTARQLQQMTSPLIVSGKDVNTATGQGFSLPAAGDFTKFLHKEAASDSFFELDDYKKFTSMAAQSGMFDYSNSVDQYKDKIVKIRKDMLLLMDIFETADPADVFKQLQRLQTSGAGPTQMTGIASKERMYSTMLGMGHQEMINTYGQQGALIYNQMDRTGYLGELSNVSNAANLTMAKRLGLLSRDEENRGHGISGMAETMTREVQGRAFDEITKLVAPFAWDGSDEGKMSKDKLSALSAGNFDVNEVVSGLGSFSQSKVLKYTAVEDKVKHELESGLGTEGVKKLVYDMAIKLADKTTMRNESEKDKAMYGMQVLKVSAPIARKTVEEMTTPEFIKAARFNEEMQYEKNLTSRIKKMEEEAHWMTKMTVKFKEAYNLFEEVLQFGRSDKAKLLEKQREENKAVGRDRPGITRTEGSGYTKNISPERAIRSIPEEHKVIDVATTITPKYNSEIEAAAKEFGIPAHILKGMVDQESGFDKDAVSSSGARGLTQLFPAAVAEVHKRYGLELPNYFDPQQNIRVGAAYLRMMYDKNPSAGFERALSAYAEGDAGQTKIEKGLSTPKNPGHSKKVMDKAENKYLVRLPKEVEQEAMKEGGFKTPTELYASEYLQSQVNSSEWVTSTEKSNKIRAWGKQQGMYSLNKAREASTDDTKADIGEDVFGKALEGSKFSPGSVLDNVAYTGDLSLLSGTGLGDNLYKAMQDAHVKSTQTVPTDAENKEYRKKADAISRDSTMSNYVQKQIFRRNPELTQKFDVANNKHLETIRSGLVDDEVANKKKLEEDIAKVSPHRAGFSVDGLSGLLDKDATYGDAYQMYVLGKVAKTKGGTVKTAKTVFDQVRTDNFKDMPLDKQGNLDVVAFKKHLITKGYAEDDVNELVRLGDLKADNVRSDTDVRDLTVGVRDVSAKKLEQYYAPAMEGFRKFATSHDITDEMLNDPKLMQAYVDTHPKNAEAAAINKSMGGNPFDVKKFVYSNPDVLSAYSNQIKSPTSGDKESKKQYKDSIDRAEAPILKELQALNANIKNNTAMLQTVYGDAKQKGIKAEANTKGNISKTDKRH